MRTRAFAVVVAAAGAVVLGATLAAGSSPSPYEQVQSARKHLAAAKAEVANADTDLTAVEAALKPKEEPPPAGKEQTAWAPASTGQVPLTDAQAAACVTHKPEVHADNTVFNAYIPTEAQLSSFHTAAASFSSLSKYVDGRDGLNAPSTDDLIQWGACKWGIPTDWLRAEYVVESNWHQFQGGNPDGTGKGIEGRGFGDLASSNFWSSPNAALTTAGAWTSLGITQVKSRPSSDPHPGTKDLRWKSTAFNIDYQAGILRYYYNGSCGWCSFKYAGQQWPSIGAWFSPGSNDTGAIDYQNKVKTVLAERRWAQSGF